MTVTCSRPGCGRRLTAKASIARQMGASCWAKDRAEKKRAALETVLRIAAAPYSDRQRADANKMIAAGKLKRTSRPGLWHATGSDDVTTYITTALSCTCPSRVTTALSCTCPSRVPCKHQCAVAMTEAYEAFGEVA